MGELQSVVWLDDDGAMLREEAPMGFVMLRESAEVAVNSGWGPGAGPDVARNAAVPASAAIGSPRTRDSLRLRLHGHSMAIPQSAEQDVRGEEILLRRAKLTGADTFELPYRSESLRASLASSSFVQVDDPKIRNTAAAATGGERDAQRAARNLNRWVFENLKKVPTVSLPNAVQVLERGEGDCNEHAVLLLALTRAAGIPSRLAAGLVYVDGTFLYHAWNEVWLGRWLPIDSALGQFPADATHIKLADGEVDAMFAVVQGVGRMSVDVIDSGGA
jgi:transglutaminase-like putative cysteine protease